MPIQLNYKKAELLGKLITKSHTLIESKVPRVALARAYFNVICVLEWDYLGLLKPFAAEIELFRDSALHDQINFNYKNYKHWA